MRTLYVIGIGSGDPEHLTVQAIKAMNKAAVFFVVDKGSEKTLLFDVRQDICKRFMERSDYRFVHIEEAPRDRRPHDYKGEVGKWHGERADRYADAMLENLGENDCGAFLVWGDPAWYDSTIRILEMILKGGRVAFDYEIIPGISSFQVLAAKHRIPLNGIGEAVTITTGRKLADEGLCSASGNAVVMLDGQCAFGAVPADAYEIFWGAYLGMPNEILRSGPLEKLPKTSCVFAKKRARQTDGSWTPTY